MKKAGKEIEGFPRVMSAKEVEVALGYSERQVYYATAQGELPVFRQNTGKKRRQFYREVVKGSVLGLTGDDLREMHQLIQSGVADAEASRQIQEKRRAREQQERQVKHD